MIPCDKCKHEFDMQGNLKQMIAEFDGKDREMTYFDCPSCKERYIIAIRTEETDKIVSEINTIKQKISKHYRQEGTFKMNMYLKGLVDREIELTKRIKEINKKTCKRYKRTLRNKDSATDLSTADVKQGGNKHD